MRDLTNGELTLNRIYHGDCFNYLGLIEKRSINLIICDLPFGVTNCSWDSELDLEKLWQFYKNIISDNGLIILFGQQAFAHKLVASNPKWFKYELIWEKTHTTSFLNVHKQPLRSHENLLIFAKPNSKTTYNPQKTTGHVKKEVKATSRKVNKSEIWNDHSKFTDYSSQERYPRSVLKFASDRQKESYHNTQKPLKLLEYLVKTYSNEGDVVLDNCVGSGTTCCACVTTNRRYLGFEIEKEFYKISMERISKMQHKNNN